MTTDTNPQHHAADRTTTGGGGYFDKDCTCHRCPNCGGRLPANSNPWNGYPYPTYPHGDGTTYPHGTDGPTSSPMPHWSVLY